MDDLTALDKTILVERHLISREHAARNVGSGLVLSRDESVCVMINEEDHLRMQALLPGFQIRQAWKTIDAVDTELEKTLRYAYSPTLGFLTACPTNLGTAIRVSAMLHLPGLVLSLETSYWIGFLENTLIRSDLGINSRETLVISIPSSFFCLAN